MKYLKIVPIAIIAIVPLAFASGFQQNNTAQEEMKKLQGVWQVITFIDHSEEAASADELKDFTFEFKEKTIIQRKGKDDKGRPGEYKVDPSKNPKWIDIDFGNVSEGIYKLDGDQLSLCVVGGGTSDGKVTPRPTEFKASKIPKYSFFELKRMKK